MYVCVREQQRCARFLAAANIECYKVVSFPSHVRIDRNVQHFIHMNILVSLHQLKLLFMLIQIRSVLQIRAQ